MLEYLKNIPRNVKIILAIAFLLRITVWLGGIADPGRFLEPDSTDYLHLAEAIDTKFHYTKQGQVEIFRAPGYSFLIALLKKISDSNAFICFIQVILDTVLCFLVWRLASHIFNDHTAITALVLQCISIVSITFSVKILSDSIYAFLLLLFLNILHETWYADENKTKEMFNSTNLAIACGVVLSLMIYLRAITLLYIYIPMVMLLVGKQIKKALVASIIVIICISPWYFRNYSKANYPHFSSVGAINLYRYNACLLLADKNNRSFNEQQALIDNEFSKFKSQFELAAFAAKRGKEEILKSPLRYTWLHMKANINNFLPAGGITADMFGFKIGERNTLGLLHSQGIVVGIDNYFHDQWWLFFCLVPTIILSGFVYCLSIVGISNCLRIQKLSLFELVLILSMCYFLLVPGGAAHPRFRVPATPILSIFAAVGFACLRKRYYSKAK